MSWEQAQGRGHLQRRMLPAAGVVVVAAAVAFATIVGRDARGTLAVRPSDPVVATASGAPSERSTPGDRPSAEPVAVTTGSGALLPGGADFTIIAADQSGWRVIEVATGAVTRWRLHGIGQWMSQALFPSGDDLVLNAGLGPSDVYRVAPDGRAVRIATRRQAIPTVADNGAVWVHDGLSDDFGGVVSLVEPDGSVRERVVLPSLTRPAVGTGAGLLVTTDAGTALVSDGRVRPVLADATVVAADPDRVAHVTCDPAPSCEVLIGSYDQPEQHRLLLAPGDVPGGYFGPGLGRFSPDGRWLALPVFTQSARGYITIVDTRTGERVGRPEGSARPFSSALAWSPDSEWLVLSSGDGIDAWNSGSGGVVNMDTGAVQALAVR